MYCSKCGKENEDSADFCWSCGAKLVHGSASADIITGKTTDDATLPHNESAVSKDPAPNEATSDNASVETSRQIDTSQIANVDQYASTDGAKPDASTKRNKTLKIAIAAVAAIIVIAIISVSVYSNNEKNRYNDYISTVTNMQSKMLSSGATAETQMNLTKSVWHNAIWDKSDSTTDKYTKGADDFNEALSNMASDSTVKSRISSLKSSKSEVDDLMKKLNNPPKGLESCYDTASDLYTEYCKMISLATDPSGSLQTYSSDCSSADSNFMTQYEKLTTKIPEYK